MLHERVVILNILTVQHPYSDESERFVEPEAEHVGGGVDVAKGAVEGERVAGVVGREALRGDELDDVTRADEFLPVLHDPLEFGLGEVSGRNADSPDVGQGGRGERARLAKQRVQFPQFRDRGNEYPIVVRLREEDREQITDIGDVLVNTPRWNASTIPRLTSGLIPKSSACRTMVPAMPQWCDQCYHRAREWCFPAA